MAVDMFIKIKGIEGKSKDHKHGKEIDVLAWSWGLSQSGSFHHGGGGGSGKVNIQDLSFTKYLDKASPLLLLASSNGEHIPEVLLTVRKAGKEALEYLKIKLEKVIVSSVSTGGSGGEDKLTENVTLNFAKVALTYSEQKEDGTAAPGIDYKWDIEANKQA